MINEELEVSGRFGLKLREEDEKKEKIAILTVFNQWGQTLSREGKNYPESQYAQVVSDLTDMTSKLLEEEAKYYHDYFFLIEKDTGKLQVKNKYNVHLRVLTIRLAKDFLDGKVLL